MTLTEIEEPTRNTGYVIFYASRDSAGEMWCIDCRNVESAVASAFTDVAGADGQIVYVGARSMWKTATHPYRQAPWNVESIPTIIHFVEGQEVGRLVEKEILDGEKVGQFVRGDESSKT